MGGMAHMSEQMHDTDMLQSAVDGFFSGQDKNGDGYISAKEFKHRDNEPEGEKDEL